MNRDEGRSAPGDGHDEAVDEDEGPEAVDLTEEDRAHAENQKAYGDDHPAAVAVVYPADEGLADAVDEPAYRNGRGDGAAAPPEIVGHGDDEHPKAVPGARGQEEGEEAGG